jgi:hypothetical protein
VHIERSNSTLKIKPANLRRNYAIGIASSTDSGEHWKYYGDVIRPQADNLATPNQNIGGVPFVVVEEGGKQYFYVYFNEYTSTATANALTAVARRELDTVLAMIENNTTATPWKKYNNTTWNADGFTGAGTDLLESIKYSTPGYYYNFDMHTDAVYVRSTRVWALIVNTTKVISGGSVVAETGLKYFQSINGIDWNEIRTIDSSTGNNFMFSFSSIMPINASGRRDGSVVNDKFAIVYVKIPIVGGKLDIEQPEVKRVDVRYPSIIPVLINNQ